jgi:hypothetical protein
MAAILLRLAFLAIGLGAVEIGLPGALVGGSLAGWILVLLVGLPLIVAGSAGFMAPLLRSGSPKGVPDA